MVLLTTRTLRVFCSDFPNNIMGIIISHMDYKNNLSTKTNWACRPKRRRREGWLGSTGSLGVPHKCATPAGQP